MDKKIENSKEYVDYTPLADIIDSKQAVKLYLDLPGANKDCLEINVEDHVMKITADTGIIYDGKSLRYTRSFAISDELDTGKATATMNNGVLELTIPKAESAKAMKIAVTG